MLVPRFHLLSALGDRRALLARPAALAPEPGGNQTVGETSGSAEAYGVRAGMRLGEALARCPELALVTPDQDRAETEWGGVLRRLEGIGAAVESERPGEAFFEAGGLRGLWGGRLEGVLGRARRAIEAPARLGSGPTRFCAYAAASRARPRRKPIIVSAAATRPFLAPLPVSLLGDRLAAEASPGARPTPSELQETLGRLGIRTLGDLAALAPGEVADRFGAVGLRAHEMASGNDEQLRPRRIAEELTEHLDLPEATSGLQLERAVSLLIDRLLAHPARRGRSFRRLRLGARLAQGGWRTEVALRRASSSPERLRLALLPKLADLPGPVLRLDLRAVALGPQANEQSSLVRSQRERRRERLGEAIRQVRAAAGRDAILRVLEIDPRSRIPERRAALAPFPEPQESLPGSRGGSSAEGT